MFQAVVLSEHLRAWTVCLKKQHDTVSSLKGKGARSRVFECNRVMQALALGIQICPGQRGWNPEENRFRSTWGWSLGPRGWGPRRHRADSRNVPPWYLHREGDCLAKPVFAGLFFLTGKAAISPILGSEKAKIQRSLLLPIPWEAKPSKGDRDVCCRPNSCVSANFQKDSTYCGQ